MTFNPNSEIRSDNTRRSSGGGGGMRRGGAIALGGGGLGTLVLVIVLLFLGVDPSMLLGGGAGPAPSAQQPQQGTVLEECQTGADANDNDDCLVQATVESADSL